MTLIDAILKAENDEERKYKSPPPEIDESFHSVKIKRPYKYAHVQAKVDSSPPRYVHSHKIHALETWSRWFDDLFKENVSMLTLIRQAHFLKGRVDSHWHRRPIRPMQHYWNRVDFLKRVHRENLMLYNLIITTPSRLPTTVELNRDWVRNKRKIVMQANNKFVLFSPVPYEEMEDHAFRAAADVKRPRVYIKLGMRDGAAIGELCIELFTEVCPDTCNLFLDLLDGDTLGHGYVHTCFFRKVPHLYWSGGDVIYNNGYGCYAQRGRVMPIGAENYHYPHSMAGRSYIFILVAQKLRNNIVHFPGLLSMRVTVDDEMCGMFNITFKPLPQLDLRNVVFGRVIRPSNTYNIIREMGNALSSRPVIEIWASRRKVDGRWVRGAPNTKLPKSPVSWNHK